MKQPRARVSTAQRSVSGKMAGTAHGHWNQRVCKPPLPPPPSPRNGRRGQAQRTRPDGRRVPKARGGEEGAVVRATRRLVFSSRCADEEHRSMQPTMLLCLAHSLAYMYDVLHPSSDSNISVERIAELLNITGAPREGR